MGYSDFLFVRPSYLEGMARLFDTAGVLNEYNTSMSAEEADALAMWADWRSVSADLASAVAQFHDQNHLTGLASAEAKQTPASRAAAR